MPSNCSGICCSQVPLSVGIIWAYAFFLTAGGAYKFKGCSSNVPSSNILLDSCRRPAEIMRRCRTDVSDAWRTAAWVRVPYPFQWGPPTFHFKTAVIMMIVSVVASVDSVSSSCQGAIKADILLSWINIHNISQIMNELTLSGTSAAFIISCCFVAGQFKPSNTWSC
jgi:hypothetical protein